MRKGHHGHHHVRGEKFAGKRAEFIKTHPEFLDLRQKFQEGKQKLKTDHPEFMKLRNEFWKSENKQEFIKTHPEFLDLRQKFYEGNQKLKADHPEFMKLRNELWGTHPKFAGKMEGRGDNQEYKHCGNQKMLTPNKKAGGSDDHHNPMKHGHHDVQSLGEDFFPVDSI